MYGCESWTKKKAENWRIDAFELWCWRRLLRPLDCKKIQPVHPKGNKSWMFIGRTDAETETTILLPPDAKNWLIGKDWGQGEKEDEMVGWYHQFYGHELEEAPRVRDGQGNLACCSPWECKESDTTEWLNWRLQTDKWDDAILLNDEKYLQVIYMQNIYKIHITQ